MKKIKYTILITILMVSFMNGCSNIKVDMRIKMSEEEFNSILPDESKKYLTLNYAEKLISPLYSKFSNDSELRKLMESLTEPQRVFFTYIEFQEEIYNGGIAQFFLNQPILKDYAKLALINLDEKELENQYEKLLYKFKQKENEFDLFMEEDDRANYLNYLNSHDFDLLFYDKLIEIQKKLIIYIKENKNQFIK